MQDPNNLKPQDSQDQPAATFKPAPNPFEKSTTAPVEMALPDQEETQVPLEPEQDSPATTVGAQNDIELVGKRADEKPESGQLEQPKKRSAVAAVFSPFSKKPEPTDTKTKHKNLNKEKDVTVIIITHDQHVADETNRIVRLVDGEIVEDKKSR